LAKCRASVSPTSVEIWGELVFQMARTARCTIHCATSCEEAETGRQIG
jgi:hypothetical protein